MGRGIWQSNGNRSLDGWSCHWNRRAEIGASDGRSCVGVEPIGATRRSVA
jgi:hypothetical protein